MKFNKIFNEAIWTGGSMSNLNTLLFLYKDNIDNILKKYSKVSFILCREYKRRNSPFSDFNVLADFKSLEEIDSKSDTLRDKFYIFEIKSIIQITKNSKYRKSYQIACKWDKNTAKLTPKDFYGPDENGYNVIL